MSELENTPLLDLAKIQSQLESMTAGERLQWASELFGDQLAMLASMQKTSSVLIHLFSSLALQQEILFVDTGFHFRETLLLRDLMMRKYRLNLVTIYPNQTPEEQEATFQRKLHLFVDGQPECCRLRKEEPFLNYVLATGKRMIISGVRRSEGGRRSHLRFVIADPRINGYVIHPILDWSDSQVQEYLEKHDVPVHPLHAQNYPSIGCQCCTTAVAPGEDPRAGRWRHLRTDSEQPAYCGINFTDGSGI